MTTLLRNRVHPLRPGLRGHGGEIVVITAVMLLSGALHAWNMFGFPYFENDEATYISRGWQFLTTGELDVYTYRYDHAPAGWIVMAGWLGLTGGPAVGGSLLASGRVLMLVVHLVSTVLVYFIAKRVSMGSIPAGVVAATVFAASPLGVYFQRRVLLDNLLVMWLLIAIALLLVRRVSLNIVIASGIVFGIATLTKLNAVFFGLGFLVLIWARTDRARRAHALAYWLAFAASTIAVFFIYALLNEELWSAPVGGDGRPERVSLIDTFQVQLGRGEFAWPWDPASSFQSAIGSWLLKDWLTLTVGALAVVLLLALGIRARRRNALPLAIVVFAVSYVVFLARGGVVIDLYVTPLLPMLAIAIGAVPGLLLNETPRRFARPVLATAAVVGLLAAYAIVAPTRYLTSDETTNQQRALDWIADNVEPEAVIAADNYVYPELAQEADFDNTLYFFTAEYDPESRALFGDDWRNLDYLVVTHEVVEQISQGTVPDMSEALDHAELRADFSDDSTSYVDMDAPISTNGDWARIYELKSRNEIVLQDAWQHYRDEWVVSYGQVLSPSPRGGGVTTSTDQVNALEQALEADDRATFLSLWQWTNDHLRHRAGDSLVSWRWVTGRDGSGTLASADTVCGTDLRFIAALSAASERWGDTPPLADTAAQMADDWWRECTFVSDGMRYIDSSADGSEDDQLVDPAAFDPGLIRSVAAHHPGYDWESVVAGGYDLLDRLFAERGTVPDWIVIDTAGELSSAAPLFGPAADEFGEDALRLVPALIRAERDGDVRAAAELDRLAPLFVAYHQAVPSRAATATAGLLAQVRDVGLDPVRLYTDGIAADYREGAWGDGDSLADHDWATFWHRSQHLLPSEARVPIQ